MATEGQTAVGPNGERAVYTNGQWVVVSGAPEQGVSAIPIPESPGARADRMRNEEAANRDETRTDIAARGEGREVAKTAFQQAQALRDEFSARPAVKAYGTILRNYAAGISADPTTAGDQMLINSYATMLNPTSTVMLGEYEATQQIDPVIQQVKTRLQKEFGWDGAGRISPQARAQLLAEMQDLTVNANQAYNQDRAIYESLARRYGFDPAEVVPPHAGAPFIDEIRQSLTDREHLAQKGDRTGADANSPGLSGTTTDESPNIPQPPTGSYQDSLMGQGMSGVNEGIASTLGLPADAATWAMNLVPRGINAVANTDIPTIQDPFLGSDWFKQRMGEYGMTYAPSEDGTNQFARRVGQSVGSAAVPIGMTANTGRAAMAGLTSAISGGVGGAAAQQIAPGNVGAEFAGEMLGSLAGGGIGLIGARNAAQRQIEAGIPTVPQLKDQASQLYQRAEQNGVTAGPQQTQELADNLMGALRQEGRVSPTGRISETYPKALEGMQLVSDYAGQPMSPTQMQTVRSVISDGLSSAEPAERRLSGMLVDQFDQWANPMAPELVQARDVSSRYLNAQQLERARELAAANASTYTGSGLENALRNQYRQLDRNSIKGGGRYSEDLQGAIQTVNRGTDLSNVARGLGKLAPTGVVSAGLGMGVPAMIGTAMAGPVGGAAAGLGAGALGAFSRKSAERMTMRAADVAELTARNGGVIPLAPAIDPETARVVAAAMAAQSANDAVGPVQQQGRAGANQPQGFRTGVGRASPQPRGLFGRPGK